MLPFSDRFRYRLDLRNGELLFRSFLHLSGGHQLYKLAQFN